MPDQQASTQTDTICRYTVDQYIDRLTEYHGNFAPGLLIGGYMVDIAVKRMTEYEFFDVICETTACLPDAVQILTPCTVGNGWLKIVNTGRFAIALYEKRSGNGVRVSIDVTKLDQYPEIKNWFLKLLPKHEQDKTALLKEIRAAGRAILSMKSIQVLPAVRGKHRKDRIVVCESCGEAYPDNGSTRCPACQGMDIYAQPA